MLKRIILYIIILVVFFYNKQLSHTHEIDGMFHLATELSSGWNTGLGGGIGVTFDLKEVPLGILQLRVDGSYIRWKNQFHTSNIYLRYVAFTGLRFSLKILAGYIRPFIDLGGEINYEKNEFNPSETDNKVSFGFTPGIGAQIKLSSVLLGMHIRYHLLRDSYVTFTPTLGLRF